MINLSIYGGQPIDAIKAEESERAIRMDKALIEKFENANRAKK